MIEEGLYEYASAGLPGVEVWPLMLPEGRSVPAVTYQVISTRPEYTCEGPSNYPINVQFDCWAESYAEVKALQNSLRMLFDGYTGMMGVHQTYLTEIETELDDFDIADRLYRVTLFINIFFRGL